MYRYYIYILYICIICIYLNMLLNFLITQQISCHLDTPVLMTYQKGPLESSYDMSERFSSITIYNKLPKAEENVHFCFNIYT